MSMQKSSKYNIMLHRINFDAWVTFQIVQDKFSLFQWYQFNNIVCKLSVKKPKIHLLFNFSELILVITIDISWFGVEFLWDLSRVWNTTVEDLSWGPQLRTLSRRAGL